MPAYQLPTPPPAIVEKVPMHLVQLPIKLGAESKRALEAAELAMCANFTSSHTGRSGEKLKSSSEMDAAHCLAIVQSAVRNGTISDLPAMVLALSSAQFTDSQGRDNVGRVMDDIATKIAAVPAGTIALNYHFPGIDPSEAVLKPFTMEELKAVIVRDGRRSVTPEMTMLRIIPIDPSTAYVFTAADVVAHPARYTTEGMTLAQTIANARTRHSAADDARITKSCFDNDQTQGVHECQQVAARDTTEMILKGQFTAYNPELYSPARVAATASVLRQGSQRYLDIYNCQRVFEETAAYNGDLDKKSTDGYKVSIGLVSALIFEGKTLGMTSYEVLEDWKLRNIIRVSINTQEFKQQLERCASGKFKDLGLQYYERYGQTLF